MSVLKSDAPIIHVTNIRLTKARYRARAAVAYIDISISDKDGYEHTWRNVRLVFDGYLEIRLPIGNYSLLVEGQYATHSRVINGIPPCWQRAALGAVYNAFCATETAGKNVDAEKEMV